MYRVMMVEDDSIISQEVKNFLEQWGYQVDLVSDFQNVLGQFIQDEPQLILLDITLPFYNGFYWCQKIREVSNVPIMFLSSASDNMNMVMAMNMGADDFVVKPFDLTFLHAKLEALLRRSYQYTTSTSLLEWQGAILHLADARLTKDQKEITLTKNEFKILQTLLENRGKIISRDTLMVKLWETDLYVDENTLNVNVNRLRKKLEELGLTNVILTKKGMGYMAIC